MATNQIETLHKVLFNIYQAHNCNRSLSKSISYVFIRARKMRLETISDQNCFMHYVDPRAHDVPYE